jgi:polar amino acid transport system substrate-binding protein
MKRLAVLTAAATLLLSAGCGAGNYEATPLPVAETPSASPSAPPSTTAPPAQCANPLASYDPISTLPDPNSMPPGTYMQKIQSRGRLIAGVSADTLLLGARNPLTNTIEGFDIDMLRAVSQAIFGQPDRIDFKVITAAQRIDALRNGSVDIVARAMTINCARWQQIAFSAQYYQAGQKVLVKANSTAKSKDDLVHGERVCAPTGTSSYDNLSLFPEKVVKVGSDTHTGCLVLFQQGKVDAITGDDTVLAGLAAQDPYAKVLQAPRFTSEPYGLGISQAHPDFVRFVNKVLENVKADGRWTASYNRWLAGALGPAPAPPTPVYGRAP